MQEQDAEHTTLGAAPQPKGRDPASCNGVIASRGKLPPNASR